MIDNLRSLRVLLCPYCVFWNHLIQSSRITVWTHWHSISNTALCPSPVCEMCVSFSCLFSLPRCSCVFLVAQRRAYWKGRLQRMNSILTDCLLRLCLLGGLMYLEWAERTITWQGREWKGLTKQSTSFLSKRIGKRLFLNNSNCRCRTTLWCHGGLSSCLRWVVLVLCPTWIGLSMWIHHRKEKVWDFLHVGFSWCRKSLFFYRTKRRVMKTRKRYCQWYCW